MASPLQERVQTFLTVLESRSCPQMRQTTMRSSLIAGVPAGSASCCPGRSPSYTTVFSSDCRLRDLSRHGAQIVVTSNDTVDKDACLIVVRDGTVHQTTTVWTDGLRRGVRFVDTFALTSGVPTHLQGMRRLWLENLPR